MKWDMAISWQVWGLHGNYGMYVAITGVYMATFQ